jgi:phosphoenolpyruvate carboxylase
LSGWYGVGSALDRLKSQDAGMFREIGNTMTQWAPLHYLISNVATSLAATDLEIMQSYAAMVEDESLRNRFMSRIAAELRLTRVHIEDIYGGPLNEKRPNVQRMINLRAEGLKVLHHQQINLLRLWRSYHRMQQPQSAEALIPQLLLTVNAIASGLGTTG